MVHYCRLNVCTTSAFEWLPAGRGSGVAAYLAISIRPSLSSLCAANYRFAKLTFLWWNNGVAEDGAEETRRARGARAESRKGQFDANRAIVVRVNRLRLSSANPPTVSAEHNSRFVSLYFIPRALGELRRYRYPRGAAISATR